MTTTLLLDLLVAALLSATIFYCWQLNRRLVVLRGGHDELRLLIENLNEATRRAQSATVELKSSSDAVGTRLNGQVAGAQALVDELKLIVEAGNTLADRVSGGLRGVSGRPIPGGRPAPAEKVADGAPELRAERPGTLRPVPRDKAPKETAPKDKGVAQDKGAAEGRGAVAALAAGAGKGGPAELLRALRDVR